MASPSNAKSTPSQDPDNIGAEPFQSQELASLPSTHLPSMDLPSTEVQILLDYECIIPVPPPYLSQVPTTPLPSSIYSPTLIFPQETGLSPLTHISTKEPPPLEGWKLPAPERPTPVHPLPISQYPTTPLSS